MSPTSPQSGTRPGPCDARRPGSSYRNERGLIGFQGEVELGDFFHLPVLSLSLSLSRPFCALCHESRPASIFLGCPDGDRLCTFGWMDAKFRYRMHEKVGAKIQDKGRLGHKQGTLEHSRPGLRQLSEANRAHRPLKAIEEQLEHVKRFPPVGPDTTAPAWPAITFWYIIVRSPEEPISSQPTKKGSGTSAEPDITQHDR